MDTRVIGTVETKLYPIATSTVIEAGDLVAKSGGYIIKATATSTMVSRAMEAHIAAAGTTVINVSVGRVRLLIDSSDVYAVAQRGVEHDIAVSGGGKATVNQSGTTYKVLMVDLKQRSELAVGGTTDIAVIINKPIDHALIA